MKRADQHNMVPRTMNTIHSQSTALKRMGAWLAALLVGLLTGTQAFAADPAKGKEIFSGQCARCHSPALEKPSTGPALMGLMDRIPGKEWAYKWIRNSSEVIASGDAYAVKIYEANGKAKMDPFPNITDEEIDNILAFIQEYKPAGAPDPNQAGGLDPSKNPTLRSMRGWVYFLLIVVILLLGNVAMLVARARGIDLGGNLDWDKINAWMFLGFFALIIGTFIYCSVIFKDYYLLSNPASDHGIKLDQMFWITMVIVVLVFVITNGLLFWFAFRYFKKEGRKALFYPENHKLEMIWTVIPAVVLTVLVIFGIRAWHYTMDSWDTIMKKRGEDLSTITHIELSGQQFTWMIRYPGADKQFGKIDLHLIDDATNRLGVDPNSPGAKDDFMSDTLFLPLGRRVNLKIRSRDVIHSVYLPHFRVKMDAVPGMPTAFHFLPTISTDSMRTLTGDPEFDYELACTEICGRGHFSMMRKVVVLEAAEWDAWYAKRYQIDPAFKIAETENNTEENPGQPAAEPEKILAEK